MQRFAGEWAVALREMAALGAEVMVTGHGAPIIGGDRIHQALTDTAELLESLESQTLALMNQGVALDRVLHEVSMPDHLLDRPYLQPVYDHPQFIVRNIWRLYGGWYDGADCQGLVEIGHEEVPASGGVQRGGDPVGAQTVGVGFDYAGDGTGWMAIL